MSTLSKRRKKIGLIKELDRSLRKWGRDKIIEAIWVWQIDLTYRCARLAQKGKKVQARIEGNLSQALLDGLNPHLNTYLYGEEKNGANKRKNPGVQREKT